MQPNPLRKSSNKEIEGGSYLGELRSIKVVQKENKQDKKMEDWVVFEFYLPDPDVNVRTQKRPYLSEKTHLYKMLVGMEGKTKIDSFNMDLDKIWSFLNSLIGKSYMLNVVPSNGYNNIEAVVPLPKTRKSVPVEPVVKTAEDEDEDDIPF